MKANSLNPGARARYAELLVGIVFFEKLAPFPTIWIVWDPMVTLCVCVKSRPFPWIAKELVRFDFFAQPFGFAVDKQVVTPDAAVVQLSNGIVVSFWQAVVLLLQMMLAEWVPSAHDWKVPDAEEDMFVVCWRGE
jgi:hypothetical protein